MMRRFPIFLPMAGITAEARTGVRAGENSGRSLGNVNIVRRLFGFDAWPAQDKSYIISVSGLQGEGIAVFLQEAGRGRIIGSALYQKPLH